MIVSISLAGALSANYPFATIDPNIGIVSVPDERIVKLGELYHTKKVTPATIEFAESAPAFVSELNNVDFPTFGSPTMPSFMVYISPLN